MGRTAQEIRSLPRLRHPAFMQNGNGITHLPDDLQIVGDEQGGEVHSLLEHLDGDVERRGRFVQDEKFRFQRPGRRSRIREDKKEKFVELNGTDVNEQFPVGSRFTV